MAVLSDHALRDELRRKGIRIVNDLTNRQAALVTEAKKNGKFGYIRKGELVVEDRRSSRTKAAHRQEQNRTATAVIPGNDIADNHNHDDYPEMQRPDHRYLCDPSPFREVTECDSNAAAGRDSIGAVDQRRCHPDNRSRPTSGKHAVNEERADGSRLKADRATTNDNSTNGGRGRGPGTPPKARVTKPGVVTRNRAAGREEERQGRIDDMLGHRTSRQSNASSAWK